MNMLLASAPVWLLLTVMNLHSYRRHPRRLTLVTAILCAVNFVLFSILGAMAWGTP